MSEQTTSEHSGSRPRRRDLLVGGSALAAAATVAAVGVASPAGAVVPPPQVPVYQPFGPARVYDSRDGDGPIASNHLRVLGPASAPPNTELAYTYNLTVTGTVGTGFLGVFSADIDWPGNSSINWFGPNQLIANNVFTAFDVTGAISIICGGGGSTDFVLDLVAMSVLTDVTSPVSFAAQAGVDHSSRRLLKKN